MRPLPSMKRKAPPMSLLPTPCPVRLTIVKMADASAMLEADLHQRRALRLLIRRQIPPAIRKHRPEMAKLVTRRVMAALLKVANSLPE